MSADIPPEHDAQLRATVDAMGELLKTLGLHLGMWSLLNIVVGFTVRQEPDRDQLCERITNELEALLKQRIRELNRRHTLN